MISLTDFYREPFDLYHISPKDFAFPCRDEINKAREWSPWHSNGVLGLWCSTFPIRCKAFGEFAYRIQMKDTTRWSQVEFGDFQRLTSDMKDYSELIPYLRERTDVVLLKDALPYIGETIVMNFEQIDVFEQVTLKGDEDREVCWIT